MTGQIYIAMEPIYTGIAHVFTGEYHLYLVYSPDGDPSGNPNGLKYIEGLPDDNESSSSYGQLVVAVDEGIQGSSHELVSGSGTKDPFTDSTTNYTTLNLGGRDAGDVWNEMKDYATSLGSTNDLGQTATGLPYPTLGGTHVDTGLGLNSTSVADSILDSVGIDLRQNLPKFGGDTGSDSPSLWQLLGQGDILDGSGDDNFDVQNGQHGDFYDRGGSNTVNIHPGGSMNYYKDADPGSSDAINLAGRGPSDVTYGRSGNDLHIMDSSGHDIATIKDFFSGGDTGLSQLTFGNGGSPVDLSDSAAFAAAHDLYSPAEKAGFWLGNMLDDWAAVMAHGSPLVLDLSATGTGISLSSLSDDPVYWDIRSEGVRHLSSWVSGDTGLLCIDLNSNGKIDDNSELFGDRPANGTTGTANGFETLAAYDSNSDGVINSSDTQFSDLLVWVDSNHDGVSQSGELHTLADLNITSIDLSYSSVDYDISGSTIKQESTFTMDGDTRTIADAWFAYDSVNTVYNGDYTLDPDTQFLPEERGYGLLPNLSISMSLDSDLKDLVIDLASQSPSDLFDSGYGLKDKITAIMYQWAGVQDVDPSDRGGYFDAQKLGFLEHLMDQPLWNDAGAYPGGTVLPYVDEAWNNAFSLVATNLLGQTSLGALLGVSNYDLPTDTLSGGAFDEQTILRFASPFTGSAITSSENSLSDSGWNDIYVLQAGDAPVSNGGMTIWEPTSQGTDTILLGGIDPADVKMWDDNYGQLHIDYTSTDEIIVENGTYSESTGISLGSIEQIMFDDGTTWDITQGLHLTASSGFSDVYGTAYGDTIEGNSSWNRLYGFDGNDTLISNGGGDDMFGGAGANIYIVSSSGELVDQTDGGSASIQGIAAGAKMWTDTSGNLYFGNENHTVIYVTVNEGSYNETTGFTPGPVTSVTYDDNSTVDLTAGLHLSGAGTLYGTAYGDILDGDSGWNTLYGYAGNDTLTSNGGGDYLYGGTGNDSYVVSNGDYVYENSGEGTDAVVIHSVSAEDIHLYDDYYGNLHVTWGSNDAVIANGSYDGSTGFTVGNVEQITLDSSTIDLTGGLHLTVASGDLYGTSYGDILDGGSGWNTLYGYAGNDTLTSNGGGDYLYGGTGDDTYIISSGDTIFENSGEGTDTALAGFSYTLDSNVENLTLTGTSNINGTGNSLDNIIIGNSGANSLSGDDGNDTLDGGSGADTLTGGNGADTFVFHAATAYNNVDTVTDFNTTDGDVLDIRNLLTSYDPGTMNITDFVRITDVGSDSKVEIDRDGTGSTYGWTQIATLAGVTGLTDEAALVSSNNLLVH